MKKACSCILIFAYLAAVFHYTIPYLSYQLNYSYFATEACINKSKPHLECNGKCQLKMMVKNQHDEDHTAPDNAVHIQKSSSSSIFYWQEPVSLSPSLQSSTLYWINDREAYSQHMVSPPAPPPRLG